MSPFPVTKSFLAAEVLAQRIGQAYGWAKVRCQLMTASMRDVYLVTADQKPYIFFIYRHNQRPAAEIMAEWQFVDYLDAHSVPVAPAGQ